MTYCTTFFASTYGSLRCKLWSFFHCLGSELGTVRRPIPGFHLLSSSVTISFPAIRFSQNSLTFSDSGKRPDNPQIDNSSIVTRLLVKVMSRKDLQLEQNVSFSMFLPSFYRPFVVRWSGIIKDTSNQTNTFKKHKKELFMSYCILQLTLVKRRSTPKHLRYLWPNAYHLTV